MNSLWILGVAVAFQIAAIYGLGRIDASEIPLRLALPAAHIILVPFLIFNRHLLGTWFVMIGLFLNLAVILANGGLMPVAPSTVGELGRHDPGALELGQHIPSTKNVLLASDQTHFWELSDHILVQVPGLISKAISLGDIFVFGGALVTLAEIIRRYLRNSGNRLIVTTGS